MMKRVLGNISSDIDPKVTVKVYYCIYFVNASVPLPLVEANSNVAGHRSHNVEGSGQFWAIFHVKVKGQIMYFLVNYLPLNCWT